MGLIQNLISKNSYGPLCGFRFTGLKFKLSGIQGGKHCFYNRRYAPQRAILPLSKFVISLLIIKS